ncbi:multiple sugar transport system substrate-binding protein [Paenibacillus sp. BK033]|uniref:ABC transporter substrate-binding protein n=1 Tax=Paenibacillus sp. BK033 TaxID=2512133 RepID=UPI0010F348B9|nr:extracellular solute-binding protein [Paenibacillus sp. BK033]TCM96475.1 multiple sugar transport system substrate-binding protein [Paenibacillus sp. BK033]
MKNRGLIILAVSLIVLVTAACSTNKGMEAGDKASHEPGKSAVPSDAASNAEPDGDASGGGQKTVVFSVFWPEEQYEQVVKSYEAAHPNIKIKLQYGLSEPYSDEGGGEQTDADIDKFTTTTNTAMLAGKGPDLVDLRYLAADDYERHHLLEDLTARMDEDHTFRKTDYFTNVLGSEQGEKRLYSLPLSFSLSGMVGDRSAIAATGVRIDDHSWTWDDFMSAGKELVNANGKYKAAIASGEGLQVGGTDYFVRSIVADNYSRFVDETNRKASFDSPEFTGLLEQIKSMVDDGIVSTSGQGYFTNVSILSPEDYLTTLDLFGKDTEFYIKPHADSEPAGTSFETSSDIGINANSKVKDAAWDFLKYMMDHTTIGLPINKERFDDAVQALKKRGTITPPTIGSQPGKSFKVDETQLDRLEAFANAATRKKNASGKVLDIVFANTSAFFAGQKSAEDVAKLIQNKAMTVLNE